MKYRSNGAYAHDETQNESRADLAEAALRVSTDRNGERYGGDVYTDVSDCIANLKHFCERAGIDWLEVVDSATRSAAGDLEDGPEAARDAERFPEA